MSKEQALRRGIAAYAYERKVLLRLIRFKGGRLAFDDFERLFDGREFIKPKIRPRCGFSGDTMLLGSPFAGRFAFWFDLLQILYALGDVVVLDNPIDNTMSFCLPE